MSSKTTVRTELFIGHSIHRTRGGEACALQEVKPISCDKKLHSGETCPAQWTLVESQYLRKRTGAWDSAHDTQGIIEPQSKSSEKRADHVFLVDSRWRIGTSRWVMDHGAKMIAKDDSPPMMS